MKVNETSELCLVIKSQLELILKGRNGERIEVEEGSDPSLNELCKAVNQLIDSFNESREYILALAEGILDVIPPKKNLLISPFKQLQANLLHLTWQTGQIAAGDYNQRVYFMGDFASSFNKMIEALEEKRKTEIKLKEAQAKVKHLEGIIPICMYCKKIRDDLECWQQLEQYICEHSDARFSHGICPDCFIKMKGDFDKMKAGRS